MVFGNDTYEKSGCVMKLIPPRGTAAVGVHICARSFTTTAAACRNAPKFHGPPKQGPKKPYLESKAAAKLAAISRADSVGIWRSNGVRDEC